MTKVTTKGSVDILNAADAFEAKLNWQLFVAENEAVLYGGGEDEWRPGAPLFKKPRESLVMAIMLFEQVIRPMFELIDDTTRQRGFEDVYCGCAACNNRVCEDCDVRWLGSDPCFVCGMDDDDQPWFMPHEVRGQSSRELIWEEAMISETLESFTFLMEPFNDIMSATTAASRLMNEALEAIRARQMDYWRQVAGNPIVNFTTALSANSIILPAEYREQQSFEVTDVDSRWVDDIDVVLPEHFNTLPIGVPLPEPVFPPFEAPNQEQTLWGFNVIQRR